jgi:hypothetical protein
MPDPTPESVAEQIIKKCGEVHDSSSPVYTEGEPLACKECIVAALTLVYQSGRQEVIEEVRLLKREGSYVDEDGYIVDSLRATAQEGKG